MDLDSGLRAFGPGWGGNWLDRGIGKQLGIPRISLGHFEGWFVVIAGSLDEGRVEGAFGLWEWMEVRFRGRNLLCGDWLKCVGYVIGTVLQWLLCMGCSNGMGWGCNSVIVYWNDRNDLAITIITAT